MIHSLILFQYMYLYYFIYCLFRYTYISILVYKYCVSECFYNDVTKWKHFPRYWPFVRGIHRSPVDSLHKGQRHRVVIFSLLCTNYWANNRDAGDLRRPHTHHDVTVMCHTFSIFRSIPTQRVYASNSAFCWVATKPKTSWRLVRKTVVASLFSSDCK